MAKTKNEIGFLQGFICAIATLYKNHEEDGYCKEILRCGGYSWAEIKLHCDESDTDAIRELFNECSTCEGHGRRWTPPQGLELSNKYARCSKCKGKGEQEAPR